jgi:hypothetical protein
MYLGQQHLCLEFRQDALVSSSDPQLDLPYHDLNQPLAEQPHGEQALRHAMDLELPRQTDDLVASLQQFDLA